MMIMLHVAIALASLAVSITGLATASRRLVIYSYGSIVATVVTGCVLLVAEPSQLLRVCVSGLTYVAFATSVTYLAQRRIRHLAKQTNK